MASVVTINRPDVVAKIEAAAKRFTGGNKTEAIALAMDILEQRGLRVGSLFGMYPGSVSVREDVDLTVPILDDPMEAEIGLSE